ncbi:cysteine synthase A [Brevibacterium sandarakinum]|uniref:Cysteine synthase A n=1 Tax=Brevibacterium sandarakinum TaxID=629680 RepID=A0A1H1LEP4_BRESA|nr:cysteine synthase family protein [Brevibacterium sandarakinum]SDR73054.1 cysteine synthase A [Brevibacterium sandarakinum]
MNNGIVDSSLATIGDTPMVRLQRIVPDGAAQVIVKLEAGNPTGSYKDRMALAIIEEAEHRGDLKPGQRVVEYSGGSTGSSLAYVCAVKGYPCTIISSDTFSEEKIRTMRAFGADVVLVPSNGGLITPDLFDRMRDVLDGIVETEGAYWTDQFHNTDALIGHDALGQEMLRQTERSGIVIDAFCAAVGTAGMLAGVSRTLKAALPDVVVTALEPTTSPMLSAGHAGPHHVEGIATGIVPSLLPADLYDRVLTVDEAVARELAAPLTREEGIFAGTSSAFNIAGALRIAQELGPGHTVATVACDSGLKYLAGDLYRT